MNYDKDNQVMINQSINDFYSRFLFKIDTLLQEVGFPLDINSTFFNNLSPDVREFLISEGIQFTQRPPTENNNQETQRFVLVRNAVVEAEMNIRTIKAANNQ